MPKPDRTHETNERLLSDAAADIDRFFAAHYSNVRAPVYASSDVRDAGFKAASVDANAFPAGFNNLCPMSRGDAARELRAYFSRHHPDARRILLLPEDHTRNPFYLENVVFLSNVLHDAGIEHVIGSADPEVVYGIRGLATPQGETLDYALVTRSGLDVLAGGTKVDLVFSNNDFTTGLPAMLIGAAVPIVPDPRLGWDHRSKAKHFAAYNALAAQIAPHIGIDPWHLSVPTTEVRDVDFKAQAGLDRVAEAVQTVLDDTRRRYQAIGIEETPRAFVKDAAGTYGMGILSVTSPEEITQLNNRGRQKMDKGKYGHKVDTVIVQEGIPTRDRIRDATAEPVVYMVRGTPIGSFYRIHPERDVGDNLNQPGMSFVPVCDHARCDEAMRRASVSVKPPRIEGVVARLAALALAYEGTSGVMAAADSAQVRVPAVKVA